MASGKQEKTIVMKLLDKQKLAYTPHGYAHGAEAVDGETVAQLLGVEPGRVFKTLVTRGASKTLYVFDIPVTAELHLKKAAKAVGEKSIEMIRVNELLPLTGYVRGGCSPIGMKKQYRTVFDESALGYETIFVSAGRIGAQVELSPEVLIALTRAETADVIQEE